MLQRGLVNNPGEESVVQQKQRKRWAEEQQAMNTERREKTSKDSHTSAMNRNQNPSSS